MRSRLLTACLVLAGVLGPAAPALAVRAGTLVAPEVAAVPPASSAVALVFKGSDARELFCGGTLIAPDAVLTAAHCMEGARASRLTVVSGRSTLTDETSGQRTNVRKISVDPRWSPRRSSNDRAVLRLTQPVLAPPLALAGPGDDQPGARATVFGWGYTTPTGSTTTRLRSVGLIVRSERGCSAAYGLGYAPDSMLCASSTGRQGACDGDSGGPLTIPGADGAPRLIGVVSFGRYHCDGRDYPGVYSRVSSRVDWIATKAGLPAVP